MEWFIEMMNNNGGIYETHSGIDLYSFPDGSIYMCCDHPEAEATDKKVKLGLCRLYTSVNDLMEAFVIKSKDAVENLTPRMLLSKYKQGTIDICGSLEEGSYMWDLTFRIMGSGTCITDHDTEEQLIWHAPLLTIAGVTWYLKEYAAKHPHRLIATAPVGFRNSKFFA